MRRVVFKKVTSVVSKMALSLEGNSTSPNMKLATSNLEY